jgi:hypothetical protein
MWVITFRSDLLFIQKVLPGPTSPQKRPAVRNRGLDGPRLRLGPTLNAHRCMGQESPNQPTRCRLPATSRFKFLSHALISVPFGSTQFLLKRSCPARLTHPPNMNMICEPLEKLLTNQIYSDCLY